MRFILPLLLAMLACTYGFTPQPPPDTGGSGESAQVVDVIDGDTIDVLLSGQRVRIRYIGINTPERDEVCYAQASQANAALVAGKTVRLVKDISETDVFDRLLRYVYVGDTFVNAALVQQGVAEVTSYPPDTRHFEEILALEKAAQAANLGCHPSGIFNDGTYAR
jgi:micrococcal nuclease